MILKSLRIPAFRNLSDLKLEFDHQKNYLFGDNGQGKTNILESIYCLCLARSFKSRDDSDLIPLQGDKYYLEGWFDRNDLHIKNALGYSKKEGKIYKSNNKRLLPLSSLIGQFPVIILSTDDQSITNGPPAQRRRFFNILLCQCSTVYLQHLKEYEKILKQRNFILSQISKNPSQNHHPQLEVWTEQMIQKGYLLNMARHKAVEEINEYIKPYYRQISLSRADFRIAYRPDVEICPDREKSIANFRTKCETYSAKEKIQGTSLIGPQRDEFVFHIDKKDIRRYGSRGEHKSALVSLKAAEANILQKRTSMSPILLLDDLYSELDIERVKQALVLFSSSSQMFITGTTFDLNVIKDEIDNQNHKVYIVKEGKTVDDV